MDETSRVPSLNLQPLRRTRCTSDTPNPTVNTSPLVSPRNPEQPVAAGPQTSPRLITHIDSPRPSPETVQRRLSAGHAKKPSSQLRKSQTELTMTQHLKTKEQQIDALKPLATVSGMTRADLVIKPVGIVADSEKKNAIDSPPLGRLESHIAPMHLLEQVIRSPGGGIELRQVLGVYTSKKAAVHAAQTFVQENPEKVYQSENPVQLVTSEVPIDKPPTGNHSHEPVTLAHDK